MVNLNIDVLRQSAAEACQYARYNDNRIQKPIIKFYEEGIKSPSVANIVMREQLQKSIHKTNKKALLTGETIADIINHTRTTLKNIKFNKFTSVLPYQNAFIDKYHNMYPKTMLLREYLINHDRIKMNKVTKKAGWLKKLMIAKHFGLK